MLIRLLVAGFLVAHALIHTGFVSPRPPVAAGGPPWPFSLDGSWAGALGLDAGLARVLGLALVVVTVGGFALGALVALGAVPATLWSGAIVAGAVGSLGLLVLFFHPWLVIGIAIDLVLLWAVLVAEWAPDSLATS